MPEDNIEHESFTGISTDSLLVYENKYIMPNIIPIPNIIPK